MRHAPATLTLAATALLAPAGPTLAQTTYEVVDIGSSTGEWSTGSDINDDGQVVGTLAGFDQIDRPFSWRDGVLTLLPTPPNTGRASATRVSDTGVIVGWASTVGAFIPRAQMWENGKRTDIGTLGGDDAGAMGVSPDGGHIVGWARPTKGDLSEAVGFRGFLWDHAGMRDLGTLPVGYWSQANDINADGQIVGLSGSKNDSEQGVLFDPEQGVIHLGTLGGLNSRAQRINASGQIVGTSGTGAVAHSRMVEHAFLWDDGAMTDLGVLDGDNTSWGMGINDAGEVVGYSINTRGSSWAWRGFVWIDGRMHDLNDLIEPGHGWTILGADAVNNHGWITGRASLDGTVHAVLLKPRR